MLLNAFCYRLVAFGNDLRFLGLWEFKILKTSKPASNLKAGLKCFPKRPLGQEIAKDGSRILIRAPLQSPSSTPSKEVPFPSPSSSPNLLLSAL